MATLTGQCNISRLLKPCINWFMAKIATCYLPITNKISATQDLSVHWLMFTLNGYCADNIN